MRISRALPFLLVAAFSACATQGGLTWVQGAGETPRPTAAADVAPLTSAATTANAATTPSPDDLPPLAADACNGAPDCAEDPVVVSVQGSTPRPAPATTLPTDLFRNTYYDFPAEGTGTKDATLFDASCKAITAVPRDFHDRVCVQGSGRLAAGRTVSFAKRGCDCADVCPRTGQKICFEALDPKKFPYGRGATGKAITPLRTIAVDSAVIPLGTPVYIADFVGLPRPDGTKHNGCFVAEDRGVRVIGRQVDVFTGDPTVTAQWNKLLPSNRGVRVSPNDPKCPKAP